MTIDATQDDAVCHDVNSSASGVREAASLLGSACDGMRLKVSREKPKRTDIVELAARRCLVGSDPNCDVRVDDPGVAAIECLILRGAQRNIIRWCDASHAFAGGELFEDEVLQSGESLQVGPIELELLVDEILALEQPVENETQQDSSQDRLGEYVSRLERLELQLTELQQASEATATRTDVDCLNDHRSNNEFHTTISDLATQLALLQSRNMTDRDLWANEKAELEASLSSRLSEFDLLQDEVKRLRDELATARSEYEKAPVDDGSSERLAEVSQALAECTVSLDQERSERDHERSEFQRQLQENLERLEQFEAQLAEQNARQADSEAARQAAEARADRLQESVEELSTRLAEQQDQYEKVRAEWEVDRAALESELVDAKDRIAQSPTKDAMEQELRDAWARERTALQRQIEEANSRVEAVQGEFDAERTRLEEEYQRLATSQSQPFDHAIETDEARLSCEINDQPSNPMDRLLGASSLVDESMPFEAAESAYATPPFECDSLVDTPSSDDCYQPGSYANETYGADQYGRAECGGQTASGWSSAAHLNDATLDEVTLGNPLPVPVESTFDESPYESSMPTEDAGEEIAFESASSDPPVNTADVLARLGQSSTWAEDAEASESEGSEFGETGNPQLDAFLRPAEPEPIESQYEPPTYTPVNAAPSVSPSEPSQGASDDEEESIEAYMARLMNRVRATDDGDEPRQSLEPNSERTPVTEYTEVEPTPQPMRQAEPEKFNEEEYKPRSQAPEMADRMTAMRSLANDSARSAIASHAKRNLSSVMKMKLGVSVFAFVAVLASIIFFWGNLLLMGLGTLVGLGVLAYWARTAITYRKLLLESLILEPNGGDHDDSDEDAA